MESSCFICSEALSPEGLEDQPNGKCVENAMQKIRKCLLLPPRPPQQLKAQPVFCDTCLPLVERVIAINRDLLVGDMKVAHVAGFIGKRILDSNHPKNKLAKRSLKWTLFQEPVIQNFVGGKLPNPRVMLATDPEIGEMAERLAEEAGQVTEVDSEEEAPTQKKKVDNKRGGKGMQRSINDFLMGQHQSNSGGKRKSEVTLSTPVLNKKVKGKPKASPAQTPTPKEQDSYEDDVEESDDDDLFDKVVTVKENRGQKNGSKRKILVATPANTNKKAKVEPSVQVQTTPTPKKSNKKGKANIDTVKEQATPMSTRNKSNKAQVVESPEESKTPPTPPSKKSTPNLKKSTKLPFPSSSKMRFSVPHQPLYGDLVTPRSPDAESDEEAKTPLPPVKVPPKKKKTTTKEVEVILSCPVEDCPEDFSGNFSDLVEHYAKYHLNLAAKLSKKLHALKCKECDLIVKLNVKDLANAASDLMAGMEISTHFLRQHHAQFKVEEPVEGNQPSTPATTNKAKKSAPPPPISTPYSSQEEEEEPTPKKGGRQRTIGDYFTPKSASFAATPRRQDSLQEKKMREDSEQLEKTPVTSVRGGDGGNRGRKSTQPTPRNSKKKVEEDESENEVEEVSAPKSAKVVEVVTLPPEPKAGPKSKTQKKNATATQSKDLPEIQEKKAASLEPAQQPPSVAARPKAAPKSRQIAQLNKEREQQDEEEVVNEPVVVKLKPGPKSKKENVESVQKELEARPRPGPKSKTQKTTSCDPVTIPFDNVQEDKVEEEVKLPEKKRPSTKPKAGPKSKMQLKATATYKEEDEVAKGLKLSSVLANINGEEKTAAWNKLDSSSLSADDFEEDYEEKSKSFLKRSGKSKSAVASPKQVAGLAPVFTSMLKENDVKSSASAPTTPTTTTKAQPASKKNTSATAVVNFKMDKKLMDSLKKKFGNKEEEPIKVEQKITPATTTTTTLQKVPSEEENENEENKQKFHCPECNIPWMDGYEPFLEHMWEHKTTSQKEAACDALIAVDIPKTVREQMICDGRSPTTFKFSDALVAELILRRQLFGHLQQSALLPASGGVNSKALKVANKKGQDSTHGLYLVVEKKGEKRLKCKECEYYVLVAQGQTSNAEKILIIHFLQNHFKRTFICQLCGQGFSEKAFLNKHAEVAHEGGVGVNQQLQITSS